MKLFEENEAVKHIKSRVCAPDLSDDTILDIIYLIYNYYEANGDLDLDFEENDTDDDDASAICDYVVKNLTDIDRKLIFDIVEAELDYESSLL